MQAKRSVSVRVQLQVTEKITDNGLDEVDIFFLFSLKKSRVKSSLGLAWWLHRHLGATLPPVLMVQGRAPVSILGPSSRKEEGDKE